MPHTVPPEPPTSLRAGRPAARQLPRPLGALGGTPAHQCHPPAVGPREQSCSNHKQEHATHSCTQAYACAHTTTEPPTTTTVSHTHGTAQGPHTRIHTRTHAHKHARTHTCTHAHSHAPCAHLAGGPAWPAGPVHRHCRQQTRHHVRRRGRSSPHGSGQGPAAHCGHARRVGSGGPKSVFPHACQVRLC